MVSLSSCVGRNMLKLKSRDVSVPGTINMNSVVPCDCLLLLPQPSLAPDGSVFILNFVSEILQNTSELVLKMQCLQIFTEKVSSSLMKSLFNRKQVPGVPSVCVKCQKTETFLPSFYCTTWQKLLTMNKSAIMC